MLWYYYCLRTIAYITRLQTSVSNMYISLITIFWVDLPKTVVHKMGKIPKNFIVKYTVTEKYGVIYQTINNKNAY